MIQGFDRIKNETRKMLESDFHFNAISYLVLGLFLCLALVTQYSIKGPVNNESLLIAAMAAIVAGGVFIVLPLWIVNTQILIVLWVVLLIGLGTETVPFLIHVCGPFLIHFGTKTGPLRGVVSSQNTRN